MGRSDIRDRTVTYMSSVDRCIWFFVRWLRISARISTFFAYVISPAHDPYDTRHRMIMHLIKRSDVVSNSHVFEKWWRLITRISITHDRYEIRRKCTQLSVDNKEIQFFFISYEFQIFAHSSRYWSRDELRWKLEHWDTEYYNVRGWISMASSILW